MGFKGFLFVFKEHVAVLCQKIGSFKTHEVKSPKK